MNNFILGSDMAKVLKSLGVKRGDVVIAQVALGGFGYVVGGVVSVVRGMVDYLGKDGTLVMPSFTGDNSDPREWKRPAIPRDMISKARRVIEPFSIQYSPCYKMGTVNEYFRTFPGTVRSPHPHSSFVAWGKKANEVCGTHPLDYKFGFDSPLGKLYNLNATHVMLGVPYERCVSFHLADYMLDKKIIAKKSSRILEGRKKRWVKWSDRKEIVFDYHYSELLTQFVLEKKVRACDFGGVRSIAFKIKDVLDNASDLWRKTL